MTMAVKYCGDCDEFEPDEEGSKKGYCPKIRRVVWENDFVHDDDESCEYYEED